MFHQSILKTGACVLAMTVGLTTPAAGQSSSNKSVSPVSTNLNVGREGNAQVGHAMFMTAIDRLAADDVPVQFHLTSKQMGLVAKAKKDYRRAMRAYQQAHFDEFKRARAVVAQARKQSIVLESDSESAYFVTPQQLADAKAQLRSLRDNGPQASAYHSRVWFSLSSEQQAFAISELHKVASRTSPVQRVARSSRKAHRHQPDAATVVDWDQLKAAVATLPQKDQERVMMRISQILRGQQVGNSTEWNEWRYQKSTFKVPSTQSTVADVPEDM